MDGIYTTEDRDYYDVDIIIVDEESDNNDDE